MRTARNTLVTAVLLAASVFVLYAWRVADVPIYLCDAEVLFALNSQSIASTAHDVNGRLLPLYFQVYGDMWFQPILVYFSALFLKLLPLSEWAVRLPSVALGVIDVVLMYLIAQRVFKREPLARLAAVLLALTPAHFIHSRLAMDYLYPVPFVMAWLLCLLVFLERKRRWMLFLGTSVLGIGVYSYIASMILMPVYLLLTLFVICQTASRRRPLYTVAIAGFAWPLLLLPAWLFFHPTAIADTAGRYELSDISRLLRPASAQATAGSTSSPGTAKKPLAVVMQELRRAARFSGVTGRISLYWYFFDPSYLFLMGGYANVINSTRRVGVFLMPLLVFIPVGLYAVARYRRTPVNLVLALGLASAPLAACLVVPEPYAIDRELELLPFAIVIATFGVDHMLAARQQVWRRAAFVLLAFVPLHFCFFVVDYFGDYRVTSAFWFEGNRRGALEQIIDREPRERPPAIYLSKAIPYIDAYWRFYVMKHGRQDLLERTEYFDPKNLNVQAVPERSVLLTTPDDTEVQALVAAGRLRMLALIPE
ncbi:MAG: hypothetical protein DMF91_28130, partial [Acidobacteria bacterium]